MFSNDHGVLSQCNTRLRVLYLLSIANNFSRTLAAGRQIKVVRLMKVPQYLVAVNLHEGRPSSISTSKISHVTENRNWFPVKVKCNQLTYPRSVEHEKTGKQKMTRVI